MDINGIGSNAGSTGLKTLKATQLPDAADPAAFDLNAISGGSSDISNAARLMQRLQQLGKSDPEKFKQVIAKIAEELRNAANAKPGAATHLNRLADAFAKVAQSGDLSALAPGAGAHRVHRGHHGHAHRYAANNAPDPKSQADELGQLIQNAMKQVGITAK